VTQQTTELTLVITNPSETGGGAATEYSFGAGGGSIGTAASDSWKLSGHRTGVVEGHTEVRYLDGGFCLIDRSGRTYINSGSQPVGRGRRARLSDGDTITIGRYRIRAEIHARQLDKAELEDQHDQDQCLVNGEIPEPVVRDPMSQWEEAPGLAMDLPVPAPGGQQTASPESAPDRASRQHISGAPLLRGLGVEVEFSDSDQMRLFLEEAGQTLRATVEGLLALHQDEDSRHQALRTRLQPIEDNPLRLGNDYPESIQTLFAARRSPVHLSAPAAVRESLASLNHHQQATQAAIQEALGAILHAFSPEALLRRFHGYRRGLEENEDEGRWAWDMYQHYYQELRSSRQQGFERLFQEVFEQAYDQHLRQLQREFV